MNPIQIESTLQWNLWENGGDPIVADVIPPEKDEEFALYDLVLQQELAKILVENGNDPVKVRITIEVIPE